MKDVYYVCPSCLGSGEGELRGYIPDECKTCCGEGKVNYKTNTITWNKHQILIEKMKDKKSQLKLLIPNSTSTFDSSKIRISETKEDYTGYPWNYIP